MKIRDIFFGEEHEAELISNQDSPYLVYQYEINKKMIDRRYNPNYGDNRICICGHTYDRHFDSYDNMAAVGCKYCGCNNFIEKTEENEKKIIEKAMSLCGTDKEMSLEKALKIIEALEE